MNRCACNQAESAGVSEDVRRAQLEGRTLVPIEQEPLIGETPHKVLQSWLTPNNLFYVRNHFSAPPVDESSWRLKVEGKVSSKLALSASEMRRLPKETMPVTLECAGNNRSDLNPKVPGNPFQSGALSTAIWGGVPLHLILERVGVQSGAKEVLFEGLDSGTGEPGREEAPYQRSLPLDVAMHPDTLLAYEMNGEPIPPEHGYPLRVVVPGWYGMASVKWLSRIAVVDYHFEGFFQKDRYVIEDDHGNAAPVGSIQVKSLISWPHHQESLSSDEHYVSGLAWSGRAPIRKVEFSDDGGETWREAEIFGPQYRYAWQQWRIRWEPRASGHHTLMARAEDEEGNLQPLENRWNRLGYAVNGVKPVCVDVE